LPLWRNENKKFGEQRCPFVKKMAVGHEKRQERETDKKQEEESV
jgi:hypothetical protein